MLKTEYGRPADADSRIEPERATYDLLDTLGVPYERIDHPAAMTMEACAEIDRALDAMICKNLFLCNRQKTDFYLLMIPADKRFHTKDLSSALGVSRLSFAEEEYMTRFLHLTPGSVSVMGLQFDREGRVRLVIDREVLDAPFFGCHPCINTSSLRIRTEDLTGRILPALQHPPTVVTLPRTPAEP